MPAFCSCSLHKMLPGCCVHLDNKSISFEACRGYTIATSTMRSHFIYEHYGFENAHRIMHGGGFRQMLCMLKRHIIIFFFCSGICSNIQCAQISEQIRCNKSCASVWWKQSLICWLLSSTHTHGYIHKYTYTQFDRMAILMHVISVDVCGRLFHRWNAFTDFALWMMWMLNIESMPLIDIFVNPTKDWVSKLSTFFACEFAHDKLVSCKNASLISSVTNLIRAMPYQWQPFTWQMHQYQQYSMAR